MLWNGRRRRQVVERIHMSHLHVDVVQAVDLAVQLGHHLGVLVELLQLLVLMVHWKSLTAHVTHQRWSGAWCAMRTSEHYCGHSGALAAGSRVPVHHWMLGLHVMGRRRRRWWRHHLSLGNGWRRGKGIATGRHGSTARRCIGVGSDRCGTAAARAGWRRWRLGGPWLGFGSRRCSGWVDALGVSAVGRVSVERVLRVVYIVVVSGRWIDWLLVVLAAGTVDDTVNRLGRIAEL